MGYAAPLSINSTLHPAHEPIWLYLEYILYLDIMISPGSIPYRLAITKSPLFGVFYNLYAAFLL